MDKNQIIESAVWLVSIGMLVFLVPRDKARVAYLGFIFIQMPVWILGLEVVELGLIEYPSRFFSHAVSTSFTFEYLAYPAVSAIYNVHYPISQGIWLRLGYLVAYPGVMTIIEVILERHTDLIKYVHWTWYYTFIGLMFTLQGSYWFYCWFVKDKPRFRLL